MKIQLNEISTSLQVFLHGAVTIFGVSTEIKFELKPRYIEAQTILALTVGKTTVTVDAHITAAYKHKTDKDDEFTIQKFSFMATLTLKAKKNKVWNSGITFSILFIHFSLCFVFIITWGAEELWVHVYRKISCFLWVKHNVVYHFSSSFSFCSRLLMKLTVK